MSEVTGLYPLRKVANYLVGYHVDATGQVYSTKQGTTPRKMTASGTSHKYWCFSYNGTSRTMRTDELDRYLAQDIGFQAWKKGAYISAPVETPINSKGFIVGSVSADGVSFSSRPKVHDTEQSARTECERLASMNKGQTFLYVEIKGYVKATGLSWS